MSFLSRLRLGLLLSFISGLSAPLIVPVVLSNAATSNRLAGSFAQTQTVQAQTIQAAPAFSDVSTDHWAHDYIEGLAKANIINGFGDGTFRPNEAVTRAQYAAILRQAFLSTQPFPVPSERLRRTQPAISTFADVPNNYWARNDIDMARRAGFLSGYPGNQFKPNQPLPRVQALIAIANGLGYSGGAISELPVYQDAAAIPEYARSGIAAARSADIVVNYPVPDRLMPNRSATRAEVAAFVYQALVKEGKAQPVAASGGREQQEPMTTLPTASPAPSPPPAAQPTATEILQAGEVRPLPGQLDTVPLFNSNSPEWIKQSGILLSTFPSVGKATPAAHLDYPFKGEFNLFAHHFTHTPKDLQTLYIGVLVYNPGDRPVTLSIPAAASYRLTDAPFQSQPPLLENPTGAIFSGPGIRAVDTVLRGQRTSEFPAQIIVAPKQYQMVMSGDIPTKELERPVNGRSTFMRLSSSDNLYVATLALFAPKTATGEEKKPTLQDWQALLDQGGLAMPRDKTPTPPGASGSLIYGRVAGVQSGSTWRTNLTDPGAQTLTIPAVGKSIAYGISTLRAGRMGTGQIQSASLAVRYPDTAYESHGNYGTYYDLTLPLSNSTEQTQRVSVTLATPLKEDQLSQGALRFRQPPQDFPYFRGTVRLRYQDDQGKSQTRYLHLWHRTGQVVDPLVTLALKPQEQRSLRVDFYYPPDATPPQVLSIKTLP